VRRVLPALAIVAALVGGLVVAASPAAGSGRQQTAQVRELDRLRDEYDEVLAAEVHLLVDYEKSQARKAELDMRVADLDAQVLAGQTELAAAVAELRQAEAAARVATRQLRRAIRDLARSKDRLQQRAVAAYTGTGSQGQLAGMILNARSFQEVQVASRYAGAVLDDQRTEIERHDALKQVIDDRSRAADDAERRAADVQAQLAARQAQLEASRDELVRAREAVAAEVVHQEQLLFEVRARKAETELRIASLQIESDSIGAALQGRQSGQPLTPSADGIFAMPLQNPRMGSPFGPRVHPIFGTVRMTVR
jgi:murein DD-endopeptidase MepM/ murein hydrolase activator NlpD